MSEADKDGRIAQKVADLHACLVIELHESLRDAAERLDEILPSEPHP